MQKSKFVHLLLVFLAMLCFVSCEYDTIELESVVIPPDQEISFSQDIIPIFNSNCVECHDGGTDPDLREANAYNSLINGGYVNVDNPENSGLYTVLLGGSHFTRATAQEKEIILEWIKRGANDN